MGNTTIKQQLADLARHWAEKYVRKHNLTCTWSDFYGEDLSGFCAIASGYLWASFKDAGCNPKLAYTQNDYREGHIFVIEDNEIWDITATQFDHEAVVNIPFEEAQKIDWYWQPKQIFDTPEDLLAYQIDKGWPELQTVKIKVA